MLELENTPNLTGVEISGDRYDFDNLYDALHHIVGTDETVKDHFDARIRVLSLCYDLRHAMMGNRKAFFKLSGLNEEQMAYLSLSSSKYNLYLSFEFLWPELLFIVFSLDDFIPLYAKRVKAHAWDAKIMTVRHFQSLVANLLEETVTPRQFSNIKKLMEPTSLQYESYFTQYVDIQNIKWLNMTKEQRQKNLSVIAKRFNSESTEYQKTKAEIIEVAKQYNCNPSQIHYDRDYPDVIEW